METTAKRRVVALPTRARDGSTSVERALCRRRSVRAFSAAQLTLKQLAQLLWAAQGDTGLAGRRTTPSAGACHPLEVHAIAGAVTGLAQGHYRYLPRRDALLEVAPGDLRLPLAAAAHDQAWLATAPAVLVVTAVTERTAFTYGARGERYVAIEAGCAGENVQLQAVALGLGSTLVGAFDDPGVARLLALPDTESPLLLVPVGWPAEEPR